MRLIHVGAIGLAGAAGTWLRFAIVQTLLPLSPGVPLGTLAANMLGCLAIGAVSTCADQLNWLSIESRQILVVGLLGGLTTFSSFIYELGTMSETNSLFACVYASVSILGGLMMMRFGSLLVSMMV